MLPRIMDTIANNRRQAALIFAGIVVVFIAVIVVILWPEKPIAQHELSITGLSKEQNFGYLAGTKLHAYNGLGFYTVDLTAGNKVTVLSDGVKLPKPGAVYWADSKGVLVNFSESFTLTAVQSALERRGLKLNDDTRQYTWYLDFASQELSLVNRLAVIDGMAYYSKTNNGFYYLTDGQTVRFYDVRTKRDSSVTDGSALVDISYIGGCLDGGAEEVCVIGRDSSDPRSEKLYAIREGRSELLLDSHGRLYPTNDSALFVAVESSGGDDHDTDIPEEVTADEEPAFLHNLQDRSIKEFDFRVGDQDIAIHFSSPNQFYVLNNYVIGEETTGDEPSPYRVGEITDRGSIHTQQQELVYSDGTPFVSGLTDRISHGAEELSLIGVFGESQLLLRNLQTSSELTILQTNRESVEQVVNSCVEKFGEHSQYFPDSQQFKIYFTGYDGLESKISSFSDCMTTDDPGVMLGYNYYFGVLDPVNGRIVSD